MLTQERTPTRARGSFARRPLIALLTVTFLIYSNISVFFQFYEHLRTLPIDPAWFGIIIGIFSAVSLLLRPMLSPFLHGHNARRYLATGAGLLIASLVLYRIATTTSTMLLVRSLHGLAFVLAGTSLMALLVDYVPSSRSAQFFGYLSLITLIPNTMIPPLLPALSRALGGFPPVLTLCAGMTLLVFPLIAIIGPVRKSPLDVLSPTRLSFREVLMDVKDFRVWSCLGAMLLLYSGHALVFFFLDGYGRSLAIAGTGFFLTLSTVSEIAVRVAAGSLFDRMQKTRLAFFTMAGLALGYTALALVSEPAVFFGLGAVLGLGWGIAMPVFNGLMFDVSSPRFRAFNINLGLQMF